MTRCIDEIKVGVDVPMFIQCIMELLAVDGDQPD